MQSTGPNYLTAALAAFLFQLPTVIACIAGLIITVASWRKAPTASLWAVFGFTLALALCFLVPMGQQILFRLMQDAAPAARAKASSVLGLFWSMLRAATYVLLLIAVYAGRKEPASG